MISLLLSLESVFGAMSGALFLQERMTLREYFGCALVLAAVLLFMIYLPKCAGKMLERDQYREWLEPEEEEFSGVINVWHVVRFKPYMGSGIANKNKPDS